MSVRIPPSSAPYLQAFIALYIAIPFLILTSTQSLTVPQCFPTLQVDRGAIRFILGGAQLMCPGLTSKGGKLPDADHAMPEGKVVAIGAEGKEHACMVGKLAMGTEAIKSVNKGLGVETVHFLGDGLWGYHVD